MLTRNAAATAAKAAASPASGCRPDGDEGGARERDQDQVAGIGGDAREDADEHQHVGQCMPRRDRHQLADQRLDEARLFGHADPDHRDDDDADCIEVHEVLHEAGEHEPDAVHGQQAAGGGGRVLDLVGVRIDDLIGDAQSEHVEDVRQYDHDADQDDEDDDRMRDPVADALDDVEDSLHAGRRRGAGHLSHRMHPLIRQRAHRARPVRRSGLATQAVMPLVRLSWRARAGSAPRSVYRAGSFPARTSRWGCGCGRHRGQSPRARRPCRARS